MSNAWDRLHQAANESYEWIWIAYAKNGEETAVLATVAKSPKAAEYLVRCYALANEMIPRKLGAMLAGLVHDDDQSHMLLTLLQNERERFPTDFLGAHSVVEDIMVAGVRWSRYDGKCQEAGLQILAEIVSDAIDSIEWNTAQWAAASLYTATNGQHPVLERLATSGSDLAPSLHLIADAIRSQNHETIARLVFDPNPIVDLPDDDPERHLAEELWAAALVAEVAEP